MSDRPLTNGPVTIDPDLVGILAARLDAESRTRLGRSLAVFPVSAADCGGCALEWAILRSTVHTLARHGVTIVDDPAGADVLLAMGALTHALAAAIQQAAAAMAPPHWVVAIGDCASDGGIFARTPAVAGGIAAAIPVDIVVPGCPPTPDAILDALRTVIAANT